jgi:nucleotide-binding universal stress UspA family protein
MNTSPRPRGIVVGVHDTPNSIAAMRRAVSEARKRAASVDIVHVIPADSDARVAGAADRMLSALIRRAFPAGLPDLAEPARLRIECGDPGEVLVLLCATFELLVIGACANSDRRGIYASDVVRFCLTRAPCPVIICADHGAS